MNLFQAQPISTATFSPCRQYRYRLSRVWDEARPPANFLMLNPSTADEVNNDPTVERCQRRALAMGYGGLIVTNIFAYRSTYPSALQRVADPVGPENDAMIVRVAKEAGIVVAGWGEHGAIGNRAGIVRGMLAAEGIEVFALKVNASGQPGHPLYIGYEVMPTRLLENAPA